MFAPTTMISLPAVMLLGDCRANLLEVMTLFVATAAYMPSSGDQQISFQLFVSGVVSTFQLMPLGDVLIWPVFAMAINNPRSGDQVIAFHSFACIVWFVQVIPSGDV